MFKLPFDISPSKEKINLKDPIFLIGSCFSSEIGEKLSTNKFKVLSNPFGTIYNPHSIFKLLTGNAQSDRTVKSQEVYYHWDAHGEVSGLTESATVSLFEENQSEQAVFLAECKWLIITLGTAIVYEHPNHGIVANCHKVPANQFTKRFLSKEEIIAQAQDFLDHAYKTNPKVNLIFTVSPVRHIRDGLVENNRSKAILIDAIHSIVESEPKASYFPSYEIMIDELRDYRFYSKDMIHPSAPAVDFTWGRFVDTYMDEETSRFLKDWNSLLAAINHRPFQPASSTHQSFLHATLRKLEKMNEIVDVRVEMEKLRQQIE